MKKALIFIGIALFIFGSCTNKATLPKVQNFRKETIPDKKICVPQPPEVRYIQTDDDKEP